VLENAKKQKRMIIKRLYIRRLTLVVII